VVVFRYPRDPSVNYIKRLVGLPGDHVVVRSDRITINGQPVPFKIIAPYNDGCYINMQLAEEHIGNHVHQSMLCPVPLFPSPVTPAGCNRSESRGYYCGGDEAGGGPTADAMVDDAPPFETTVPPGSYFMMGDNRDNSADSRYFGFVPRRNIVGRASSVAISFDPERFYLPRSGRYAQSLY
jgi:signal peptidase I